MKHQSTFLGKNAERFDFFTSGSEKERKGREKRREEKRREEKRREEKRREGEEEKKRRREAKIDIP